MDTIWKSLSQNEYFNKNGFLLIDLLSTEDLEKLNVLYRKNSFDYSEYFYSSSFIPDEKTRINISQEICQIITPYVDNLLKEYKELGAVFLIKPPHQNSIMPIHQDWTVVDEDKFQSITFWIPLQDTTINNGALKVLPRSHKLSKAFRSPTLENSISDIIPLAEPMMQPIEMKAGQALVFSHALLHASYSNMSNSPRIAIAYGVISHQAELILYHKETSNSIVEKLTLPKDFFISYPEPGKRPKGSLLIDSFEYKLQKVSQKQFNNYYLTEKKANSFFDRIKKFISSS